MILEALSTEAFQKKTVLAQIMQIVVVTEKKNFFFRKADLEINNMEQNKESLENKLEVGNWIQLRGDWPTNGNITQAVGQQLYRSGQPAPTDSYSSSTFLQKLYKLNFKYTVKSRCEGGLKLQRLFVSFFVLYKIVYSPEI